VLHCVPSVALCCSGEGDADDDGEDDSLLFFETRLRSSSLEVAVCVVCVAVQVVCVAVRVVCVAVHAAMCFARCVAVGAGGSFAVHVAVRVAVSVALRVAACLDLTLLVRTSGARKRGSCT